MKHGTIIIKGAREHNLKNIDLELPRDKLIVFTGLSGSGKSSLAFDTIYAEGQRRYVESLSAYARQFLEQMEKPDIDLIEGLSPAISIEQKTTSKNPRSTVGTVTEIYDYLRILFARVGTVHCYNCGKAIESQTVSQIVDQLMLLKEGTRIHVMAPVVKDRKGEYKKELAALKSKGFVRARIDGKMQPLDEEITLEKTYKHSIDVVIDRLVIKPGLDRRLADSAELALNMGEGFMAVSDEDNKKDFIFSQKFACVKCGISYPAVEPRMFSFNNPHGACQTCTGLGVKQVVTEDLVVPDKKLTLAEGAIRPWGDKTQHYHRAMLESLAEHYGFSWEETRWMDIPKETRKKILNGAGAEEIRFKYLKDGRKAHYIGEYEGVIPNLERRHKESESNWVREDIEQYMRTDPCHACNGARLRPEPLSVKIGGKNIVETTQFSIKNAVEYFDALDLTPQQTIIAARLIKEIKERLGFMQNVGLEYLTLDRGSSTLSGGEGQRIRLATQIGSALVGVLYILDEPSIGLHQRDNDRLLATLVRLRDIGNTVIVVEHDRDTISAADHVVDLGPGAGVHGGYVVAQGTPADIRANPKSITGQYLARKLEIETPKKRRKGNGLSLSIKGAEQNNLKNISVDIPLGAFTCVTGVSGSGKSTLIIDILYKQLAKEINQASEYPGKHKEIRGIEFIDKVIDIDQSPIGRTPRSNPATYTGLFTPIRDLYTQVPESKKRGYKAGRFSFNVQGGRCEACQGDGIIRIEMHFLPDVYVTCEVCHGRRFNRETLDIHYKGKTIAEVLEMPIEEALDFFGPIPAAKNKLQTLYDVGLGYIKLGQSATTLSGGEAQRVKLARELAKRSTGRTIYILDEPTTGLHFDDIKKLLEVLNRLVETGNSVLVIEHNLDVIKTADWVIDLGPEGGDRGGTVVTTGTPEQVAKVKESWTGKYLKEELRPPPMMKEKKERKDHPFRTVLLTLEYDGTRYAGWQSQNKGEQTIQDALEKAVTVILGKRAPAVASGRTDAGVHALAQPVSIKGHFPMNDDALVRALNSLLPDDIAVKNAKTVDDSFHAIKHAKQKTYRYVIHNGPERNPLGLRYSWHVIQKLNTAEMRRGAEALVGQHDFASFMAANSSVKSSVRHIIAIDIHRKDETITIEITANGFLRQMVRNIVGTLAEIGRGRMEPDKMKEILKAKDRRKAGPTAPAQGLTLVEVEYQNTF